MTEVLPLAILFTSLGVAPVLFLLHEDSVRLRTALNLGAAVLKLALVAWLSIRVAGGDPGGAGKDSHAWGSCSQGRRLKRCHPWRGGTTRLGKGVWWGLLPGTRVENRSVPLAVG